MNQNGEVLYVYRCGECGHHGEEHFFDDLHGGEVSSCDSCGAPVTLEWDGGVVLEIPASGTDSAITETRARN